MLTGIFGVHGRSSFLGSIILIPLSSIRYFEDVSRKLIICNNLKPFFIFCKKFVRSACYTSPTCYGQEYIFIPAAVIVAAFCKSFRGRDILVVCVGVKRAYMGISRLSAKFTGRISTWLILGSIRDNQELSSAEDLQEQGKLWSIL